MTTEELKQKVENIVKEFLEERKGDVKPSLVESKKETPQEIIKETPKQPKPEPKQNNEDWYWGSLYNKLKKKWTK